MKACPEFMRISWKASELMSEYGLTEDLEGIPRYPAFTAIKSSFLAPDRSGGASDTEILGRRSCPSLVDQ